MAVFLRPKQTKPGSVDALAGLLTFYRWSRQLADHEYKRLAPHARACEGCAQQFTPKIDRGRFCRKACADRKSKTKTLCCVGCGVAVSRYVRGGSADSGLYCSRECYLRQKSARKKVRPAKPLPLHKAHVSAYVNHCAAQRAAKKADDKRTALSVRPCKQCGECVGYRFGSPRSFCSAACSVVYVKANPTEAQRRGRRVAKAKRRAKEHGVYAEKVDPIDVCSRGGWLCQLCGIATPKDKRGTNSLDAPEVDHIYPISKGGKHVRANLQCLCRSCNAWKSDKIVSTEMALHYLNNIIHDRGRVKLDSF